MIIHQKAGNCTKRQAGSREIGQLRVIWSQVAILWGQAESSDQSSDGGGLYKWLHHRQIVISWGSLFTGTTSPPSYEATLSCCAVGATGWCSHHRVSFITSRELTFIKCKSILQHHSLCFSVGAGAVQPNCHTVAGESVLSRECATDELTGWYGSASLT